MTQVHARLCFMVIALGVASGGRATAQESPLDRYVAEGLRQNLGVRQAQLASERARAELRAARGAWLPAVGVNARYTAASGNLIDIGSYLNAASSALNQVAGRPLLPTDFDLRLPLRQETTLRLTQPLFVPAIAAGVQAARGLAGVEAAQAAATRRATAARIRLAYLDHLRALAVRAIYDSTLVLVRENLRNTQRRLDAGTVTPDAIARASAEVSAVEQSRLDATRLVLASREAFNLLLDRPLGDSVEVAPDSSLGIGFEPTLESAIAQARAGREELAQVAAGEQAARGRARASAATFMPTVVAQVDYGVQGQRYRFTSSQDFLTASVVLQWNLFNGGQDAARARAAGYEVQRLQLQQQDVARQVELEVRTSWEAARTGREAIGAASARLESARRSYLLVERRHAEGLASQVELIDARTAYTNAALNRTLTTYDFYQRCVEFDRAAARYPAS